MKIFKKLPFLLFLLIGTLQSSYATEIVVDDAEFDCKTDIPHYKGNLCDPKDPSFGLCPEYCSQQKGLDSKKESENSSSANHRQEKAKASQLKTWHPQGYTLLHPGSRTGEYITGEFALSPSKDILIFKAGPKLKLTQYKLKEKSVIYKIEGGYNGNILNGNSICGSQTATFVEIPAQDGMVEFYNGTEPNSVCLQSEYKR